MSQQFIATQKKFHSFLRTQPKLVRALLHAFADMALQMTRDVVSIVGSENLVVTLRYLADTVEDGEAFAQEHADIAPAEVDGLLNDISAAIVGGANDNN